MCIVEHGGGKVLLLFLHSLINTQEDVSHSLIHSVMHESCPSLDGTAYQCLYLRHISVVIPKASPIVQVTINLVRVMAGIFIHIH